MIELGMAIVAFWAFCGGLSLLVKDDHRLTHYPFFHPVSLLVMFGLMGLMSVSLMMQFRSAGLGAFGILFVPAVVIVGVALGFRYWGTLISDVIDRLHSVAVGTDSMKVEKTYDLASKAEHEGRWQEAAALYDREATADAADAEALRRAGEAYVQLGRIEEGVARLRRAAVMVAEPEDRATAFFRVAELLEQRLGRSGEARAVLEEAARTLKGTRFEEFARERLRRQVARP